MAGPSTHWFGAPARRPRGRSGPIVLLVLGVLALAGMTHAQALDRAGPTDPSDPAGQGDTTDTGAPPVAFAFGSTTAAGAVVFRLGDPVHAWVVDAAGRPRWQRDLGQGDALACGPCPAAVLSGADGRVVMVGPDGSPAPVPASVAGGLLRTRSVTGVVLAAPRPDGAVEFLIPTGHGLVSAGSLVDARLDQPLIVVTPASGAPAVTVLRASSDPLRQAEFEVVHVTPDGSTLDTVPLDEPGARPFPCAVADATTVAYLQQRPGPTSDGSTHLVVEAGGPSPSDASAAAADATVGGAFDACAAGPGGAVLASAVTGADGDATHTVVHVVWLGPTLEVRATASEPVDATRASVAVDPASLRVAVAGGRGPVAVLDGRSRVERPPASAVAFDEQGGLWSVDVDAQVTHEVTP